MNEPMSVRKKLDAAFELMRKYRTLPRVGWAVEGSRAKTNHLIAVPREEVKQLANDLYNAISAENTFFYEAANLRHFLEQLAADEFDAVQCEKCFCTYRKGWMDGKCPYCEAAKAAASMLSTKEVP